VEEKQNITLSVSKDILRKAKIIAINRGTSLSGLITRIMEELTSQEEGFEAAQIRYLNRLESPADLGTKGDIQWSREDLHQR